MRPPKIRTANVTDTHPNRSGSLPRLALRAGSLALACTICFAALAVAGCSGSTLATGSKTASKETTAGTSGHMAGPPVEVHISQETVNSAPAPWLLTTPESAVRSYLDWVSYAYRIGQSQVATPTMSAAEEVRVDSYNQYNLENKRLLDQTLKSITFGKQSKGATSTLVPAKESWTYSYLSVAEGNRRMGGPYSVDYDTAYTVVKTSRGWVVDSVSAKALGPVK
jgi:hypothetical protein